MLVMKKNLSIQEQRESPNERTLFLPKAVKKIYADRQVRTRCLVLLLFVCFIAVFMTAQITIAANANHNCIGDGCMVCKLINNAEKLLQQMFKNILAITVLLITPFVIAAALMALGLDANNSSASFTVKVRLNI